MEFFDAHVEDEPEHIESMRKCIEDRAVPLDEADLQSGANEVLNLFNNFWAAMNQKCSST